MKVRSIIRVVAGAAVLVLVVVLFSEVRKNPTTTLADQRRARPAPEHRGPRPTAHHDESAVESRARAPEHRGDTPSARAPEPAPSPPPKSDETEAPAFPEGNPDEAEDNARIDEATRLFEQGDYSAATQMAEKLLEYRPRNNKMLWIRFASACDTQNREDALEWFERLHPRYWKKARTYCAEHGVEIGKISHYDD